MADSKKSPDLDKGFEDVPLDKGFEEQPVEQEPVSKLESARAGLASGGTFGFAPRIGAAGGALASKAAQAWSGGEGQQSLKDLYNEYLKYNNERQEKAKAGNPATYHTAEFAGALASPMNKIGAVGALAPEVPLVSKMAASAVGGAKLGGVAGLSQSKDLADIPQDVQNAAPGAVMGAGIGAVVPPVGAGLSALAKGSANMVRPLIGKPGEMFNKGMQAGVEGAPNLAGEPGQLQAVQARNEFADGFVQDLHKVLASNAKNKRELITNALENSQLAPAEAVQAVTQRYLDANPQLNEESARKELDQLKEMILTAREGGKKTETIRKYLASEVEPSAGNEPVSHKKVLSREIDPETEKDQFEADVEKKKAEIRALPGHAIDPDTIETHYEPIEGSDKVMAVARSPVMNENPAAFTGQPASFQDIQQTVREGGRNLQDPEELYALQKNLQAKSQFSEGRGFSSQEMNQMSGQAAKDVAQLIKLSVPKTVPVDQRLNAFNNVAESLGIDTDKLQLPGGEGQLARQNAMKKILGVLNPETPTDKSQLNQSTIDYVQQQLDRVHPDIGNAFGEEAAKHAETAGTMRELTKPETVGGGGPILSTIRRGLNKTAYSAGHAAGSEVNKMEPGIAQANKIFQNYTPDALQQAGAAASQSTNQAVQQMGQVLSKLATADDRTRNSMMFVLEQQAGYRSMMAPYFKKEEQGTPQAKDKTLEKYK